MLQNKIFQKFEIMFCLVCPYLWFTFQMFIVLIVDWPCCRLFQLINFNWQVIIWFCFYLKFIDADFWRKWVGKDLCLVIERYIDDYGFDFVRVPFIVRRLKNNWPKHSNGIVKFFKCLETDVKLSKINILVLKLQNLTAT